ncbi:unnamed protein product, partial [Staurois parvus]
RCAVSLGHSGSPIHEKSRRCRLGHVISCVQSQLITDDQCGPRSATCQCPSVPAVSAEKFHMPVPISAYQYTSMRHISAHQSCLSVSPISATYECRQSVPPISAIYQCCLSVPINDACLAHQCRLPVPPHQCHLSVSISAAYQCPSLQPH